MKLSDQGDHDDDVDRTTQALNWMPGPGDARGFYRYYEDEDRKRQDGTVGFSGA